MGLDFSKLIIYNEDKLKKDLSHISFFKEIILAQNWIKGIL
jgi:hypothetical protein